MAPPPPFYYQSEPNSNPSGWAYFYKVVRGKLVNTSSVRKWWESCPPEQQAHYAQRERLRKTLSKRCDRRNKIEQDRNLIGFGPLFDGDRLALEHQAVLRSSGNFQGQPRAVNTGHIPVSAGTGTARSGVGRGRNRFIEYPLTEFTPPSRAEMVQIIQRPWGWGPNNGFGIWSYGLAPPSGSVANSHVHDSSPLSAEREWFTYEDARVIT